MRAAIATKQHDVNIECDPVPFHGYNERAQCPHVWLFLRWGEHRFSLKGQKWAMQRAREMCDTVVRASQSCRRI